MDGDKSYDHVKALVSSIHGSFVDASLLDRTNNNSPSGLLTAATTPSRTPSPSPSPSPDVVRTTTEDGSQAAQTATFPADGQERAAADGAASTGAAETAGAPVTVPGNSSSTPTRLLQHRLRIPSLVVTSSLSPYHPSNLLAASADPDHTTPRRFSFAIMRRHSNTVPTNKHFAHPPPKMSICSKRSLCSLFSPIPIYHFQIPHEFRLCVRVCVCL
uniref:Uncharacterized protein n=1 Tax=Anopheles culicifacies TaxID=139723 RepID=A0A182MQS8_9DIPT